MLALNFVSVMKEVRKEFIIHQKEKKKICVNMQRFKIFKKVYSPGGNY